MKIISLRFKNLNSLYGEWAINFSDPAYGDNGIFAITGPTGAGKTTILDAVCLALYGRTPRLDRVNKSINEIMSRQAGECSSELVFETSTGRYRSHWAQHRSRRKPGGELQEPKHEVVDDKSGQVLEAARSKTALEIISLTGMTFTQFTRSIMLAQGAFAAFLEAPADERAGLLEQITGTEIYSQISMKVHARKNEEYEKLKQIDKELSSVPVFDSGDETVLHKERDGLKEEITALEKVMAEKNLAAAWLENISALEKQLVELEARQAEVKGQFDAFEAQRQRLALARRAMTLDGEYGQLKTLRRKREQSETDLKKIQSAQPAADKRVARLSAMAEEATKYLEQARQNENAARPVIKEVRALEVKISQIADRLKPLENERVRLSQIISQSRQRIDAAEKELAQAGKESDFLTERLQASSADASLEKELGAIAGRFEAIANLTRRIKDKKLAISEAEKRLTAAQAELERRTSETSALRKSITEKNENYEAINKKLTDEVLAGRELSAWRDEQLQLNRRMSVMEKMARAMNDRDQAEKQLRENTEQRWNIDSELADLNVKLNTEIQLLKAFEATAKDLETIRQLEIKVQSLEERRLELRDDQPCPLCGSFDHPWADSSKIPAFEDTAAKIRSNKEALEDKRKDIESLKVRSAALNQALTALAADSKKAEASLGIFNSDITRLLHDNDIDSQSGSESILEQIKILGQQAAALERRIKEAEKIESGLKTLADQITSLNRAIEQSGSLLNKAELARSGAGLELERDRREEKSLIDELDKALADAHKATATYGFGDFNSDEISKVYAKLKSRRDKRVTDEASLSSLTDKIKNLRHQIQSSKELGAKDDAVMEKINAEAAALLDEQSRLLKARNELLGTEKPDDHERKLAELVEQAEKRVAEAAQNHNLSVQEHEALKSRLASATELLNSFNSEIKNVETALTAKVQNLGFENEAAYLAACIASDELNGLEQTEKKLGEAQAVITSGLKDIQDNLHKERLKNLTALTLEEVRTEFRNLNGERDKFQAMLGILEQKLIDYQKALQLNQQIMESRQAQRKECDRWNRLHELIGSADGKKYRHFAQGLTFEVMVGQANRWLTRMNDRYLLIRDIREPLELSVIDNYQAGEIRSTKNLSGGERFIVSLALALGLSKMASQNVRVDSLFLDEGFGTLDEEALDIALEALSGLKEHGKLIGVISHIPALTERITAQIKVSRRSGGLGSLSGPGCSQC